MTDHKFTKLEATKLFTADEIVKLVKRALKEQTTTGNWLLSFAADDLKDRIIAAIRKAEKGK